MRKGLIIFILYIFLITISVSFVFANTIKLSKVYCGNYYSNLVTGTYEEAPSIMNKNNQAFYLYWYDSSNNRNLIYIADHCTDGFTEIFYNKYLRIVQENGVNVWYCKDSTHYSIEQYGWETYDGINVFYEAKDYNIDLVTQTCTTYNGKKSTGFVFWKKIHGWYKENSHWCYYKKGILVKNIWIQSKNKWYYIKSDGYMAENEWIKWKGNWYYLKNNGIMVTGTYIIKGKIYKFDLNGKWIE